MDERIYKKYFIGKSKPGKWSSVYAYKPHSHDIRVKRGEIFAVISLKGPDTFAVSTAGNLILDNLHENYFENHDDSALIALEKAVKAASTYLQKLLENDSAADIGIDFDLSAMAVLGDIVYFVSLGDNTTKVWREEKSTDLAPILKDPTGEGFIRVGSMIAKPGDIFFLTTEQFEKEVSDEEYQKLSETFSDIPLKERFFDDDALIAMLMLGYNLDFDEINKPVIHEVKIKKVEAMEKKEEEEASEDLENDELDVIVDETPQKEEHEEDYDDDDFMQEIEDEREDEMGDAKELAPSTPKVPLTQSIKSKIPSQIKNPLPKIGAFFTSLIKKPKSEAYRYKDEDEDGQNEETERIEEAKYEPKRPSGFVDDKPTIVYYFSKLGQKIREFFRLFWEDWLGMGRGSSNLRGVNKNRRWGFLFIVLIVVVGMIYFAAKDALDAQAKKTSEANAIKYINQASAELDTIEPEARSMAKSTITTGRDELLTRIEDVSETLDQARGIEAVADELKVQDDRIQELQDLVNKVIGVTDPTIVTDMGAKNPGSTLSDIALGNKTIYFADSKYGKIYSVGYDGKSETELATGLTSPSTLSYDNQGNVLFLDASTDRKLGIINTVDKTIQRVAGTSESRLGGVSQIEFAVIPGNSDLYRIYAIDPVNKAVYHLESRDATGYGLPVRRNINLAELASVKDIAIMDLKIYLLLPYNQGIYRAYSDQDDTPVISGLGSTDDLTKATAFFIDDVYMYVADPTTKSVYVIDKGSMQFKAKYQYRGSESYFSNIKDLVADRSSGKIFVLDGSRILALSMDKLNDF